MFENYDAENVQFFRDPSVFRQFVYANQWTHIRLQLAIHRDELPVTHRNKSIQIQFNTIDEWTVLGEQVYQPHLEVLSELVERNKKMYNQSTDRLNP